MKAWAERHGFKAPKRARDITECTPKFCRLRQAPPGKFCEGTFRTMTLPGTKGKLKAVIAKRKLK